jgi:Glycosyl transferase family 2
MSVAALLRVKDEVDIIEPVLRHLAWHVDEIFVGDVGSTDGTREILAEIDLPISALDEEDGAHYQGARMTELAEAAREAGHRWALACDADEVWYSPDGRPISAFLGGLAPDVKLVRALIFNHFPTSLDPHPREEPNPIKRIAYKQPDHAPAQWAKVAVRLVPGLAIGEGNHSAYLPMVGTETTGLELRHFSWRSEVQYVRKIANGYRALALTDLPESTGQHWRMHGSPDDPEFEARVRSCFRDVFFSRSPLADGLVHDPAPLHG